VNRLSSSEIVKVYVGNERKLYNLHKNVLCRESPFFQGCLKGEFPEGRTNEVTLNDDNPDAFDLFIGWIYTHEIAPPADKKIKFDEVYVLADKFSMEAFKNAITDSAQIYFQANFIEQNAVITLHSCGYSDSSLMKYFIDHMAFDFISQSGNSIVDSNENWENFQRFLGEKELMKKFLEAVIMMQQPFVAADMCGVPDPATEKGCKYHEHTQTKRCDFP
jgi:BTB/POZ domain